MLRDLLQLLAAPVAFVAFVWAPALAARGLDALVPDLGYLAWGLWLAWLARILTHLVLLNAAEDADGPS
jgi:hypothetical protein